MKAYLIKNQNGYFLCRSGHWADCTHQDRFFVSPHRDDALNRMVEENAKDYRLRLNVLVVKTDDKKRLEIPKQDFFVADDFGKPSIEPQDGNMLEAEKGLDGASTKEAFDQQHAAEASA